MDNNILTIVTPTFNRAANLPKLYESLKKQDKVTFKWLLIDDGSTDNTSDLAKDWINDSSRKFEMLYQYKENGGKQTALNLAYKSIDTPLTFIVDSDDWLTEDAVSTIYYYWDKYKDTSNLCGFSFWRVFPDGRVNGMPFAEDELVASFFETRILTNDGSDKAEVWYTEAMKSYAFPEYDGEKYYPEDGVWLRITRNQNMVHINKGIYYGDYLEGGITDANIKRRMRGWPRGMTHRSLVYLDNPCKTKMLIKHTLLYIMYGHFGWFDADKNVTDKNNKPANRGYTFKKLYDDTPRKGLFLLCFMPACILGWWYSR